MGEDSFQVHVSESIQVTTILSQPTVESKWLFVYAPGAGSDLDDPFGMYAHDFLTSHGIVFVRFQFPYKEHGQRRPDPPKLLEATWRAVVEEVRGESQRLAVGGRSMGGRIASQVAATGWDVDALVLFAYPLRPPSNPEKIKDQHLDSITAPTLFCSGTRDTFGTPEELRAASAKVPNSRLMLLEGADHGFKVLKSSGRTIEDVWGDALEKTVAWLTSLA